MPIACVTWIVGPTYNIITQVLKHERVTFTTVPATTAVCPDGANAVVVRCLEGDALIAPIKAGEPEVTDTTGLRVAGNEEHTFIAVPGITRISAKKPAV